MSGNSRAGTSTGLFPLGPAGRGRFLTRGPFVAGLPHTTGANLRCGRWAQCPPSPQRDTRCSAPSKPPPLPRFLSANAPTTNSKRRAAGVSATTAPPETLGQCVLQPFAPCHPLSALIDEASERRGLAGPRERPPRGPLLLGASVPRVSASVTRRTCPLYKLFPSTCGHTGLLLGQLWACPQPPSSCRRKSRAGWASGTEAGRRCPRSPGQEADPSAVPTGRTLKSACVCALSQRVGGARLWPPEGGHKTARERPLGAHCRECRCGLGDANACEFCVHVRSCARSCTFSTLPAGRPKKRTRCWSRSAPSSRLAPQHASEGGSSRNS